MITLKNVQKSYGKISVLKSLSLEMATGKTIALVGPSGCGKSTLLRMIIGLLTPNEGTITIGGTVLNPESLSSLRKKMGYVIQEGGLFPHFSARENASVAAAAQGWDSARIAKRIEEVMEIAHFRAEFLDRFPSELSGGQRQRVSLMRALMLDPEILLLDEPLGALDPIIRRDLQDELRSIFQKLGKTVIFVTHDFGEASFIGDQIILMYEGEIIQSGPPRDFLDKPANDFVRKFVHSQRMPGEGGSR